MGPNGGVLRAPWGSFLRVFNLGCFWVFLDGFVRFLSVFCGFDFFWTVLAGFDRFWPRPTVRRFLLT